MICGDFRHENKEAYGLGKLSQLTPAELELLWAAEKLSPKEIAETYDCSAVSIRIRINEWDLWRIENDESGYGKYPDVSAVLVEELYYYREWSLYKICDFLGIGNQTLRNRMDSWGLERRDRLDTIVSGEDHYCYGKESPFKDETHSEESKKIIRKKARERYESDEQHPFKLVDKPFEGKTHTEESKRKIGEAHKGKTISEETRKKLSRSAEERLSDPTNHPMSGRKHSEESKAKMREADRDISWRMTNSINEDACDIIEYYGKSNGYNFRHGLNHKNGEFQVPNTMRRVDGYDKNKNVVIEYYEEHHKNQGEYDQRRKQEIMEALGPSCKFIELYWDGRVEVTQNLDISRYGA